MNQIKTEEEKILKILTETQWPAGQNQVEYMFNESPQKRKENSLKQKIYMK